MTASALPQGAAPLLGFARLLREAGFAGSPGQAMDFMRAVTLLGPRSMEDVRQAALALLAPAPDRRGEFDALFRQWFWGDAAAVVGGGEDEEVRITDEGGGRDRPSTEPGREKGGEAASAAERLASRRFPPREAQLSALRRGLASALPRRRSLRSVAARSRGVPDLRRSLRTIVANDGDVARLPLRRRPQVQRRLLLLIDVSGSMKLHTADHLAVAHAVAQGAERAEIFTFGTRLTRITASLRPRRLDQALERVAAIVEDWDGGTRIGPALLAFLSVPRFSAFARGAAVVILSDGLERGGYAEMETALRRLSARAHRLSLATPLAADPRFRPRTAALRAVLPLLDDLVDGSSVEALTGFILSLARPAPAALTLWREAS